MGRSLTLLCLVLLAGTYASRYQFVSRTVPDSFTLRSLSLYDYAFGSLPFWTADTKEWTASAWMYITSANGNMMDVIVTYRPTLLISFYSASEIIVAGNLVSGSGIMIKGAWFHAIIGSTSSGTFGAFTKRNGGQYVYQSSGGMTLNAQTKFRGSSNPDNFSVRHM